jgi:hypothetical protein
MVILVTEFPFLQRTHHPIWNKQECDGQGEEAL